MRTWFPCFAVLCFLLFIMWNFISKNPQQLSTCMQVCDLANIHWDYGSPKGNANSWNQIYCAAEGTDWGKAGQHLNLEAPPLP